MELVKFLERRNYLKSTITEFAERVKSCGEYGARVSMSVDLAANITECLGWLEDMYDDAYNQTSIHVHEKPELKF